MRLGPYEVHVRGDDSERCIIGELWDYVDTYRIKHLVDVRRVVDVGANIGLFTLFVCDLWPSCTVVAVEPEPDNFELLTRNVTENGLADRVELLNAGVEDGTADTTMVVSNAGLSQTGAPTYRDDRLPRTTVPAVSLDSLLGVTVDLLKMDTEGAEFRFLPTAQLLGNAAYLTMELHTEIDPGAVPRILEKLSETHAIERDVSTVWGTRL